MKAKGVLVFVSAVFFINIAYSQQTELQKRESLLYLKKHKIDVVANRDGDVFRLKISDKAVIADDVYRHIAPFEKDVIGFGLYNANVSKKILECIKGMEYLKYLTVIMKTKIDDEDLKYFQSLKEIESLGLADNNITGSGLKYIKDLPLLTHLHLLGNPLKDEHLHYLAYLPNLMFLDISNTPVTDKSLQVFAKFDRPVIIVALNTKITKKARDKMEAKSKMKAAVLLYKEEINF